MNVLIMAAIAIIVTVAIFYIMDRNNKEEKKQEPDNHSKLSPQVSYKKDHELIDYGVYIMNPSERSMYIFLACAGVFVVAYIFYNNVIVSLLFSIVGFYYPRIRTRQLINRRKEELTMQFKQALQSLVSSLSAGRSVENSFLAVENDLKMLLSDRDAYIIKEFEAINIRVANGEPIEEALLHFSNRAGIDDITNFVDVFVVCKRTGGNLADVIRRTSSIIGEKLQVQQDIQVMMAQKRFEAKALVVAPVLLVALLNWSSPDYMAPLYVLGPGPFIMTAALVVFGFTVWVINRIINIKV